MNITQEQEKKSGAIEKPVKPMILPKKMEQFRVEIRKNMLNEILDAKRVQSMTPAQVASIAELKELTDSKKAEMIKNYAREIERIYKLGEFGELTKVVRAMRQVVSVHEIACIDPVREAGILQLLMNLLDLTSPKYMELVSETAWIISNVASGDTSDVALICDMDAIPKFTHLLSNDNELVREQALWALANIAGDQCLDYRNEMLENEDNFTAILGVLSQYHNLRPDSRKVILWLIMNLCRGKPYPQMEYVREFVIPLCEIIHEGKDYPNPDSLNALAFITANDDALINDVMETKIGPVLLSFLNATRLDILAPALRAIAQICSGEDHQTEALISMGCLEQLSKLLDHKYQRIVREAIWAISNILAGPIDFIDKIMKTDILEKLAGLMEHQPDQILNREILYCLSHLASSASRQQIAALVDDYRLIERLVHFGRNVDSAQSSLLVLDGLDSIFQAGEFMKSSDEMRPNHETYNPYARHLEDIGGTKLLEELQNCDDQRVYNRAFSIADRYFVTSSEQSL